MIERWWAFVVLSCLCVLGICGLQITKKTTCIDSKVVEKIDRVSEGNIESIYRCSLHKDVDFSSYFNLHLNEISNRVESIERILDAMRPFSRKVQITIFENHPLLFYIKNHRIYIGEKMLESGMHLEKALAKVWYQETISQRISTWELLEDVVTDFLIFLPAGKISFGNSKSNFFGSLVSKWPYVIKSAKEYCASPWKRSEHYLFCSNSKEMAFLNEEINENNLRAMLSFSWIMAYRQLGSSDRESFFNNLPTVLSRAYAEKSFSNSSFITTRSEPAITGMREVIEKVISFFENSSSVVQSNAFKTFSTNFRQQLAKQGLSSDPAAKLFDVLYVSAEPIPSDSVLINSFSKLAKQNSKFKMAIKDKYHLWLLPSKDPVSLKSFGHFKAHTAIVEQCGDFTIKQVSGYEPIAEKLLVIEDCSHRSVSYSSLLKKGIEEFAFQNQGLGFVQFHLPSLMMKKFNLKDESKVLNLNNREFEASYAKEFEWQQVRWNKKANAFQPKASIEAVQWFRFLN